jgi:hypothetical protein
MTLFAQSKYPTKLFISQDTVIAILPTQLTKINVAFVQLDGCLEMQDTLKYIVAKQDFAIKAQKKLITNRDEQLVISADMLKGQDNIILDYKNVYKRDQLQIKWLKVQRNTLAVAVIAFAAKVFLFH